MSAWEHYFKVMIDSHDSDELFIECALRDEFGVISIDTSPGSTDMHITMWAEFKAQIDTDREPIDRFAERVRMVIYKAAKWYSEVSVQGYIIEGGKGHFGNPDATGTLSDLVNKERSK